MAIYVEPHCAGSGGGTVKKADIQYHGSGYYANHPAVNVKVRNAYDTLSRSGLKRLNAGEFTDPAFPAWLDEHGDDEDLQIAAWESATEHYSAGRSYARQQANDIPYLMLDFVYFNVFLPEVEPQRLYAFGS